MSPEYKVRNQSGVTVIRVSGRMVVGEAKFGLMKLVTDRLEEGEREFVLDLGHVTEMDSAGVGELVAANVAAKEKGAQIHLANLDDRVGKVLQMALIHKIIPTFDTQKEAVAKFADSDGQEAE